MRMILFNLPAMRLAGYFVRFFKSVCTLQHPSLTSLLLYNCRSLFFSTVILTMPHLTLVAYPQTFYIFTT